MEHRVMAFGEYNIVDQFYLIDFPFKRILAYVAITYVNVSYQ